VEAARHGMESHLGKNAGEVHKDLPKLLASATSLPASSFR